MSLPPVARKNAVRLLFAFVGVFFALQLYTHSTLGEPYPGLVMPPFGGSGGFKDGKVVVPVMEAVFTTKDGKQTVVMQRDLLKCFPDSHHATIAFAFLSPLDETLPYEPHESARKGLRYLLFPGLGAGSVDRHVIHNKESLKSWAAERAGEFLPGETVDRVEFTWYLDTFSFGSGMEKIARKPKGVLVVQLGGECR